jgi:hypothetical protein
MNIFSGFAVATTWEASKVNAVRDAWINDFMVIPIELFGLNLPVIYFRLEPFLSAGSGFLGRAPFRLPGFVQHGFENGSSRCLKAEGLLTNLIIAPHPKRDGGHFGSSKPSSQMQIPSTPAENRRIAIVIFGKIRIFVILIDLP